MKFLATNGHVMVAISNHENKRGEIVWDYWNSAHADNCPCLQAGGDW